VCISLVKVGHIIVFRVKGDTSFLTQEASIGLTIMFLCARMAGKLQNILRKKGKFIGYY